MGLDSQSIRRLRRAKPAVDPWRPHGVLDEVERGPGGASRACRTVFLTGAECPFTCVFCDLWQYTTDSPTPRGAIPRQLEIALAEVKTDAELDTLHTLKLYNASNFFDTRAVPDEDYRAIADLARAFQTVVVECHPKLVGEPCLTFRDLLVGQLEIALGLETVHPRALAALNKQMSLEDFAEATAFARSHDISTRAFVLIGAPHIAENETLEWIERSVNCAIDHAVRQVVLIPLRAGNGALEELAGRGEFVAPSLGSIEKAFALSLRAETETSCVTLDLWDIESHDGPPCCFEARIDRLRLMNALGKCPPAVECESCGGSA